jgi:hypothetical protein
MTPRNITLSLVWVSGFPYLNPVTLLPDKSAFR